MKNNRVVKSYGKALLALLTILALGAAAPQAAPAAEKGYPSKPITFIVAFAPGGNMDGNTRMISSVMPDYLPGDASVRVKNVVGAESQKGTLALYRAKPDGYTISAFQMPSQMLDSMLFMKKDIGNAIMNVTWLGLMSTYVNVGYVKADSPYKTLADLVAHMKSGVIKIGSSGGSGLYNATLIPHVLGLKSQVVTGYKSSGEVVVGLMRKDVDLINQSVATGLEYVKNGDIRPLYIIGPKRIKEFPDTPTLTELGYPELESCIAGRFIVGPPGMDPQTAEILSQAIMKSVADKAFVKYCRAVGVDAATPAKNREQTKAMAQNMFSVWNKYIALFEKK